MDQKLEVALVQSSLVWEEPDQNRANFSLQIDAIPPNIDLIVLPEMFNTGFTMTPQHVNISEGARTLAWMQEKAKKKNAALVGSLPFFDNGAYVNRLFFVRPEGNYHRYDKRHTFTLAGEDKVYKAGKDRLVVEYKGFKICPLICYDLRFPVWSRNSLDYDVLIYVANWPKPRISAWDTLLKARAIENMAYCIGVNRVGMDESGHEYPGHSAVYDVLGEPLSFSQTEEVTFATLSMEKLQNTRNKLKFLNDRDQFTLQS